MIVEEKYTPAWYRREVEALERLNENLRKELKELKDEPDEDQSLYMVGYK